jgi:hypothetical protein
MPQAESKIKKGNTNMNRTTKTMIAGAAAAGLFSGAFASQAHASQSSSGPTQLAAGTMAVNLADSDSGKHDCKGMNSCKGQGGCKSSDNGCKGKNSCKGKGGCDTNHPKS